MFDRANRRDFQLSGQNIIKSTYVNVYNNKNPCESNV